MSETPKVTAPQTSTHDYALRFTRRTALSVAGLAGVAVVAAACGSNSTSNSNPSGSSTGTTLGPASDVPVAGGRVYPDQQVIVTQPTAGTYDAFSAICPHQGCTVAGVFQGVIVCPCHNSTFDVSTGAVLSGPAQSGLPPAKVTVTGGNIVLNS